MLNLLFRSVFVFISSNAGGGEWRAKPLTTILPSDIEWEQMGMQLPFLLRPVLVIHYLTSTI
jgi:hypothetical protein